MQLSLVLLLLVVAFVSLVDAFYIGGYYPSNRDNAWGEVQAVATASRQAQPFNRRDIIKRFKPCYYSPIQCLIKRK
ncbi:unnamed protein product [Caenorhabditis auriculariae]|uniref:Salivary secreted peptide n=1 Tax=Caenorhabditis auriculariae TaxID=2777116 RepID=A0A8S1HGZ8_9PELO|nr:unnamed protein product [Caenorhabditis auriculariae]